MFAGSRRRPRSPQSPTKEIPWVSIIAQLHQAYNLPQDSRPSLKNKEETCFHRSLPTLGCVPSLSTHNMHTRQRSAEVMNIVASCGEYKRQKPAFAFVRYLAPAHVRLACHRSRAHAPRRLYVNPMYFEGARLPCVMLFHKRLTGLQEKGNTPCTLSHD